jgi:2-polyprenyl-6-methoxyphenol hydroxylase-like FAD-dependent oxidoreductase
MASSLAAQGGLRVLVSGAGIAGPTLAWFLARSGARVTVLERASELLAQGQNIDLRGTALNVVHQMGVLDAIRACNTTEKGTEFIDDRGRPFATFALGEGGGGALTTEYEILRGDLAHILYKAAESQPGVDFRFGTTIERVVENGESAVRVELSSGEEVEYDVLVLADGQWSKMRKQVFGTEGLEVVDKNCYVGYYTVPRTSEDGEMSCIHIAPRSRVVLTRPDNHGTTRASFSIVPNDAAQKEAWERASRSRDRKLQMDLLRSEFGDIGWKAPRLLREMDAADDLYFQGVQQIRLAKWYKNRVVCLGDTAYAPTPLTGMGTSLAIDGAYLLAGHLSQLQPGQHPATAFQAYDEQFRPFVSKTQAIPVFVPRILHPQAAWSRWIVQTLIATAARVSRLSWITKLFATNKPTTLSDGLVAELDAPFPSFPAFRRS